MTIEQTDVIDFISKDESENIVLTISDHLEWDVDNEHLYLLQEKLNSYLRFLESGEVYESYEGSKGKNFIIKVSCKYLPNKTSEDFLKKAEKAINEAGFSFTWRVVDNAS